MTADQPTPTSSLEEARTDLLTGAEEHTRNGGDWSEERTHNGCVCCCDTCDFNTERLVAAARAEVIREVEALTATVKDAQHLLRFVASDVKPRDVPAIMRVLASAEVTHEDCCSEQGIAALRALSQGGEGESDG